MNVNGPNRHVGTNIRGSNSDPPSTFATPDPDSSHLAVVSLRLGMNLDLRLVASEHPSPRDHLAIDMLHHDVGGIVVSERAVGFRNRNGGMLSDEMHCGRF
jgi:hypothetical protein